jgi:HEAT repeat protein
LIPLLGSNDRELRIVAARALCKMGAAAGPAVPAMAELLTEKDGRQRYQIEVALGNLGPDARKAVPALIERLEDVEKDGRSPHPVLETLGKIGPKAKAAVPALIELLKTAKEFYINDAMDTLGRIGPGAEEAVPVIVLHLKDKSEYSRIAAARALGGIGPDAKAAVPALKKLLEDDKRPVQVWAAFALARITGEAKPQVAFMIEMWKEDKDDEGPFSSQARFDIAQALERLGPEVRPARDLLLEALPNISALGTLSHVAATLGNLGDDANVIVPKMLTLVERKLEPGSRLRWNQEAAIEVLGALGPKAKAAAPALRKLLDSNEFGIADAAAKALEKIEAK